MRTIVVALALSIGGSLLFAELQAAAPQAANPVDVPPAVVALITTFADGKSKCDLVAAKPGRFWTPTFPRIASSAAPQHGLPIRALQIARELVGSDVRATVSLLRGQSLEQETVVKVATVSRGAHVVVNELRAFGVQPIELTLGEADAEIPFLPSVVSVSPLLEFTAVDILTAPYPGYRVHLRNLSPTPIATFHVQSYRGSEQALSTVRAGSKGRPAMAPGESYAFDLNLASAVNREAGRCSPRLIDVIEIDGVLWENGATAGDLRNAAPRMIPVDAGRRLVLEQAVEILRAAQRGADAGAMLADVTRGFEAIDSEDPTRLEAARAAMRDTKATLLAELAQFEKSRGALERIRVREWVRYTLDRYTRWIARLSPV